MFLTSKAVLVTPLQYAQALQRGHSQSVMCSSELAVGGWGEGDSSVACSLIITSQTIYTPVLQHYSKPLPLAPQTGGACSVQGR